MNLRWRSARPKENAEEMGADVAGLLFAETTIRDDVKICFLLEVLKNPTTTFRVMPLLLRRLLEVEDAVEFHLIVDRETLRFALRAQLRSGVGGFGELIWRALSVRASSLGKCTACPRLVAKPAELLTSSLTTKGRSSS